MMDMREMNQAVIAEHRRTGGQVTGELAGIPVLLLTTTGRRSGRPHTTPLGFVDDGGRLFVAGSNAGSPTHPNWYRNLLVTPSATVEVDGRTVDVTAVELHGDERDRAFERLKAALPPMADYEAIAGRTIPVVALVER